MLVFMCRDPGDATSKVSCCVEPSYGFKNRDFDASTKVPVALPLKISLSKNKTTVNLSSLSYFYTTHIQSQIKPRLLFGNSNNDSTFFLWWLWLTLVKISSAPYVGHTRPSWVRRMESLLMSLWITPCVWRTDSAFRTDRHTVAICSSFILQREWGHMTCQFRLHHLWGCSYISDVYFRLNLQSGEMCSTHTHTKLS